MALWILGWSSEARRREETISSVRESQSEKLCSAVLMEDGEQEGRWERGSVWSHEEVRVVVIGERPQSIKRSWY
jgi:hypothetical protein